MFVRKPTRPVKMAPRRCVVGLGPPNSAIHAYAVLPIETGTAVPSQRPKIRLEIDPKLYKGLEKERKDFQERAKAVQARVNKNIK